MLNVHEPTQAEPAQAEPAQAQTPPDARKPVAPRTVPMVRRVNPGVLWGIGLILFGGLTLVGLVTGWTGVQLGILPTLALVFLLAGISGRSAGLMIPAGILTGLSVGTILARVLEGKLASDVIGGLVVLSLGLGFALIVALQVIFTTWTHWWPFIPASILVLIGAALIVGGATSPVLQVLGYMWPIAVIAVGAWIVLRALTRGPTDRPHGTPEPR